ncbi:unnamed protein product, partial [Didymodactylos carnosus]
TLHKIEQELGTEIQPIPKQIDPSLYVAEYQIGEKDGSDENTNIEKNNETGFINENKQGLMRSQTSQEQYQHMTANA